VFSQPVFCADVWRRLRDDVATAGCRFFPGLLPLVSLRNAEALAGGRIPGIRVPESLVAEFARYPSRTDQRKFGLDRALDLGQTIAREGRGIYLIMPFGKTCYDDTAALVQAIRRTCAE
jgi:5,10-methylenetetrahydrofolate reductase